ncbi:MAG: VOC family protein, partial [Mesorhizobium sp.]
MTENTPARPHPLDHLVLPTASLDVARARLTLLGFTVAPTGIHPFGTENCCVFLTDGTYLEPLAVAD